jgi:SAM-dependent methyltransferase
VRDNLFEVCARDGRVYPVDPRWRVYGDACSLVCLGTGRRLAALRDVDGCLSDGMIASLLQAGTLQDPARSIFANPELCEAVFGWSVDTETAFLRQCVAAVSATRCYDAGCGYGRLAGRLAHAGLHVIGADRSLPLIRYGRQRSAGIPHLELVVADITSFVPTEPVHLVYSAMNTVRYLVTGQQIKKHIRTLRNALRDDGLLCLHTTVMADASTRYRNSWEFHFAGAGHAATWAAHSVCRRTRTMIDHVTVVRLDSGEQIYEEYQHQAWLTYDYFMQVVEETGCFRLKRVHDDQGAPVDTKPENGNFWFLLEPI